MQCPKCLFNMDIHLYQVGCVTFVKKKFEDELVHQRNISCSSHQINRFNVSQPKDLIVFNITQFTGLLWNFGTNFTLKTDVLNQDGFLPMILHRVLLR